MKVTYQEDHNTYLLELHGFADTTHASRLQAIAYGLRLIYTFNSIKTSHKPHRFATIY